MRALVVGKGGREHALVKALSQSDTIDSVYALPGNHGMKNEAELIGAKDSSNETVLNAVHEYKIDIVVVGPEAELAQGLCSFLREHGIKCLGPGTTGAQLESSKVFSKEFMVRAGVPTAKYEIVTSLDEVIEKSSSFTPPYVLKADGLCAGKGVYICATKDELKTAAHELFNDKVFGSAGSRALLEQFKNGYELSYLVLTNGDSYEPLPLCQDHKRLGENDTGPNTGGMGVVGPLNIDPMLEAKIRDQVVAPSIQQLGEEKMDYWGVLYIGLMISGDEISVLEYNVRFGDPEAQIILPLLDGDWGKVFNSLASGELLPLRWKNKYASCIVLAAQNYPENPVKGVPIKGPLEKGELDSYIIHAGTQYIQDSWVTNGGRVLNAVAIGESLRDSQTKAYSLVSKVHWPGMQFRKDIGFRAIK